MLCHVKLHFPLFKSSNFHTSLPPSPSSSYSSSSSMSCSNHHSNFSRKPRMSVRQVWKRKTSTPKSSPPSQNDSPPLLPRVYLQSPSPPSYNPLRDQMINQLHNISTILDSHTNPSNAYIHAPPSPSPVSHICKIPYVRRMIPEPGDADREVPVPETFHEQTDDELTVA
ncbi:hypothetical protein Tco_1513589, partial [Tanacetum coccineum]